MNIPSPSWGSSFSAMLITSLPRLKKHQPSGTRRKIGKSDYQSKGIMYLPDEARYSYLLNLPEGRNIGKAVNDAMKAIESESENEELKGVLPQTYTRFENDVLVALLKHFSNIPMDIEGHAFGKIYEYFLGEFAMSEGKKGGEFFTPTSLVKLIVEVIEPFHGRIYDPAGGSGGMFVQSAKFLERHKKKASSASDARQSELDIRQKMIEGNVVDVIIAIGSNFFYTVTLPCTLWFLDKSKAKFTPSPIKPSPQNPSPSGRGAGGEGLTVNGARYRNTILFIDARHIYRQLDRAHRGFLPEQIEFISSIVRLYRGEEIETDNGSGKLMKEHFPKGKYRDIDGLCKVATIDQIKGHSYSLNPCRYVGVAEKEEDDGDFYEKLEELNEELEKLNTEARDLEERIADNVEKLLEQH